MIQDIRRTLRAAADKLRFSINAAEDKQIVLGLIFIKYIFDAFDERRAQREAESSDQSSDLHLPDPWDHADALEERDFFTMINAL